MKNQRHDFINYKIKNLKSCKILSALSKITSLNFGIQID